LRATMSAIRHPCLIMGQCPSNFEGRNTMLRGWFNYFKHAYRTQYKGIDGFIRRRLRAILLQWNKGNGLGIAEKAHRQWPNTYFAEMGLFTMHEARLIACQSRCRNCQPESRVRENRTHGSEGGAG
ncbi:MAG: Group II intron, maturase-specific domain, partial [Candidatus Kentron sp. G]